jgi:hypothetical protein
MLLENLEPKLHKSNKKVFSDMVHTYGVAFVDKTHHNIGFQ